MAFLTGGLHQHFYDSIWTLTRASNLKSSPCSVPFRVQTQCYVIETIWGWKPVRRETGFESSASSWRELPEKSFLVMEEPLERSQLGTKVVRSSLFLSFGTSALRMCCTVRCSVGLLKSCGHVSSDIRRSVRSSSLQSVVDPNFAAEVVFLKRDKCPFTFSEALGLFLSIFTIGILK